MVLSLSRVPPPVVRKTTVAGWPLFFLCAPHFADSRSSTLRAQDFLLIIAAMVASARFVRKIVAAIELEIPVESGEHSQRSEGTDPEYGQDDREQK
jgi:hypothetical protein